MSILKLCSVAGIFYFIFLKKGGFVKLMFIKYVILLIFNTPAMKLDPFTIAFYRICLNQKIKMSTERHAMGYFHYVYCA